MVSPLTLKNIMDTPEKNLLALCDAIEDVYRENTTGERARKLQKTTDLTIREISERLGVTYGVIWYHIYGREEK